MRHTESKCQQSVLKWWALAHRGLGVVDARLLFAIPNGGARNAVTGSILKAEGVRAGVPDLFLAMPNTTRGGRYHGLFLEMKTWANKPTLAQREMMARFRSEGYDCRVAHSFDQAVKALTGYLNGREGEEGDATC